MSAKKDSFSFILYSTLEQVVCLGFWEILASSVCDTAVLKEIQGRRRKVNS